MRGSEGLTAIPSQQTNPSGRFSSILLSSPVTAQGARERRGRPPEYDLHTETLLRGQWRSRSDPKNQRECPFDTEKRVRED